MTGPRARLADAVTAVAAEAEALAAMTDASDRYAAYARDILAAATHLRDVAGAPRPATAAADLREIAEQARTMLSLRAAARRLDVPPVSGPPAPVRGDGAQILQIVANLLTNAVKFTPGGGTIAIAVAAGDGVATLDIADSGPGIAARDSERVFEEFRQLSRAPGIGLGLPISRNLARGMGGDLTLIPSPAGARFRLTLPAG